MYNMRYIARYIARYYTKKIDIEQILTTNMIKFRLKYQFVAKCHG